MSQRSAYAWQFVVDADNRPLSYYAISRPNGPAPLSGTITWLDVPSPANPATPPAPPGPPPTPQPKPKVEFENPYWEGVKGFFGGLKTGAKAVVNSSVDTVASTVTLGQYDPPDVWQVDPNTDLYYAQSRFFADIATNAASAAATGGLSGSAGRLGQVARIADKLDTVGNVINGVKGADDAANNGLNLQNGVQIVGGAIGGAQAYRALNNAKIANVAGGLSAAKPTAVLSVVEGVQTAPATFVRTVQRGEKIADLIAEGKAQTWLNEAEHAILTVEKAGGEGLQRIVVRGGRDGIELLQKGGDLFVEVEGQLAKVRRVLGHTHPRATGPSAGDISVLQILGQSSSFIFEIGGEVNDTLFRSI